MTLLLDILDWTFVLVLGLPVLYLFVFAAASTRARKDTYPPARRQKPLYLSTSPVFIL